MAWMMENINKLLNSKNDPLHPVQAEKNIWQPRTGHKITVCGWIPNGYDRFAINLTGNDDDIAFHFNPRFDKVELPYIVCNTFTGKKWGHEERTSYVPFKAGEDVEIVIKVEEMYYQVFVNHKFILHYRHRLPTHTVNRVVVKGSLKQSKIEIEDMGSSQSWDCTTDRGKPGTHSPLESSVSHMPDSLSSSQKKVVTGATAGIGKAYAFELAKRGLNVVLISRSLEKLNQVAAEIEEQHGRKTKVIQADFTHGSEIYEPIQDALQGLEIGVLVNNVGISQERPTHFLRIPDGNKHVDNIVNCNMLSMVKVASAVFLCRKKGIVINLSSFLGRRPYPMMVMYSASKAFNDFFSRVLDMEYGPKGIIVQSVLPMFVDTNLIRSVHAVCVMSPKAFVRQALDTVGITNRTAGCLSHAILASDTFRPEDLGYDYGNTSDSYDNSSDFYCMTPHCDVNPIQGFARTFLPPFYSLICLLGLWGNGMVIAVLLRAKEALPRTDIFIFNLAVADILFVLTLPFWAVQEVYGWIFGNFLCKVVGGIFKINYYASIFFLVCISFDRYLSIVHVIRMYNRNTMSVFHLFSLALWLFCFLLTLPDFIYLSTDFDSRQNVRSCALNPPDMRWKISLDFVNQIGAFLLPLLAMAYFYTHIIFTLLLSKGLHKYKALRVILAVVAAFFFCWSPYHVVQFVNTLIDLEILSSDCKREERVDIAAIITTAVGFLHCCLNPPLYAFIGVKFRNKFLDLLERLGCLFTGYPDIDPNAMPCTQSEIGAFARYFGPAVFSVGFVAGLLGNGLVLAVLGGHRCPWFFADYLLFQLAVADLLLVFTLPFWATQFAQNWVFGEFLCKFVGALSTMNSYSTIFLLTTFSVERYLAIMHAVQVHRCLKLFHLCLACVLLWGVSVALSAVELHFRTVSYIPQAGAVICHRDFRPKEAESWRLGLRLISFMFGFLLPLLGMAFCYCRILARLHQGGLSCKATPLCLVLVITLLFLLCWGPFHGFLLVDSLQRLGHLARDCAREKALDLGLLFSQSLGLLHSCLNPLAYALVGVKFRREVSRIFHNWIRCKLRRQSLNVPQHSQAT
ncbi:hypothetical protein JRQ81_011487 [Phrynocephalus forsythii]|uniref:C-X-C chemokine receptor type 3 n=1 Tax=Phrynocephalus forsythii TaxID=171643 RepID=A0A9Q1AQL9_9SAUR|nr:hypothetical protein JRQ81_011487 [Phrynocephalus forsythii]